MRTSRAAARQGAWASAVLVAVASIASGQSVQTLYEFPDVSRADQPAGNLLVTKSGAIVGQTWYVPVVFRLSPPKAGESTWQYRRLDALPFQSIGTGGLAADSAGNLYGAEVRQRFGPGRVFRLSPPVGTSGHWTFASLHVFNNDNDSGETPEASPIVAGQNLYGTTSRGGSGGAGVVYSLTPGSDGTWTYTVLHAFSGSDGSASLAPLIADKSGNLYGTTSAGGTFNGGTVFELSPPANATSPWTFQVLYQFRGSAAKDGFDSEASLVLGRGGSLFGTTVQGGSNIECNGAGRIGRGCGTVFGLHPPTTPGGPWAERVLHVFTGYTDGQDGGAPLASLTFGDGGSLYGTTACGGNENQGTIFTLTPPAGPGGRWSYKSVWSFDTGSDNPGRIPLGPLVRGPAGVFYGTTSAVDFSYSRTLPGGLIFQFTP